MKREKLTPPAQGGSAMISAISVVLHLHDLFKTLAVVSPSYEMRRIYDARAALADRYVRRACDGACGQ
jgi:hypothetical protein